MLKALENIWQLLFLQWCIFSTYCYVFISRSAKKAGSQHKWSQPSSYLSSICLVTRKIWCFPQYPHHQPFFFASLIWNTKLFWSHDNVGTREVSREKLVGRKTRLTLALPSTWAVQWEYVPVTWRGNYSDGNNLSNPKLWFTGKCIWGCIWCLVLFWKLPKTWVKVPECQDWSAIEVLQTPWRIFCTSAQWDINLASNWCCYCIF